MTTIHRISLACILSLVGLTADAAIGTVRIAGKGIGAIADAALPGPTS